MTSLRSHEGYFLMDHRNSPGIPDGIVVAEGLIPGAGKGVFESATFTCSHCQVVVVLNPDRSRDRGYCRKCDHYVCDNCETARVASGGACFPFSSRAAQMLETADKLRTTTESFQSPLIIP